MKKIHNNSLIGQQGINLIERVVLSMGFLWYPTGGIEAGIDGYIEIRDSDTGEVTNSIILVQSKATGIQWLKETEQSFEYPCKEPDLEYWLQGNAPVILVVSRPSTQEAYWVSVKEYFGDAARRATKRVLFDKRRHVFDENSKQDFLHLGLRNDAGVYFGPDKVDETLYSNLVEVTSLPEFIYIAPTWLREGREVLDILKESGHVTQRIWNLSSKSILSFHDLAHTDWSCVCESGAAEKHSLIEWLAKDPDKHRKTLVYLMNKCLEELLRPNRIAFSKSRSCYYFLAGFDKKIRRVSYRSLQNMTSRTVFEARLNKKSQQVSYYKHSAFEGQFRVYDGRWYLEINPTYYYTHDGRYLSQFSDSYLTGIKKLENNNAVLGQVVMWHDLISRAQGMSDAPDFIRFGNQLSFDVEFGLDDDRWRAVEEDGDDEDGSVTTQPGLFDEDYTDA